MRSQWAQLFQRLLSERLAQEKSHQEFRTFSAQIEDLKAALLTSIGNGQLKETAKGVVKYRRLIDFLLGVLGPAEKQLVMSNKEWAEIVDQAGITTGRLMSFDGSSRPELVLEKFDGTFLRFRGTERMYQKIIADWDEFKSLEEGAKSAVYDALVEAADTRPNMMVRHYNTSLEEYLEGRGRTIQQGSAYDFDGDERSLGEILADSLKSTTDRDDKPSGS